MRRRWTRLDSIALAVMLVLALVLTEAQAPECPGCVGAGPVWAQGWMQWARAWEVTNRVPD